MDIIILGFGYYLVRFTLDSDRERVLLEGPWTIQGHYLTVRPWKPDFAPSADYIESTLAWARFPELYTVYYNEDVIYVIASSIGTLVKINLNTSLATMARFTRVCVEVDLTKPLVARFWLNERWHTVEYEGIHTICFGCGMYGNKIEHCPSSPVEPEKTGGENLSADQGQTRNVQGQSSNAQEPYLENRGGSRSGLGIGHSAGLVNKSTM